VICLVNGSAQVEILDLAYVEDSVASSPFAPYLYVENVLGIPKKPLIKAFVEAKNAFFLNLGNARQKVGPNLSTLNFRTANNSWS
jgi:hypothetical protein